MTSFDLYDWLLAQPEQEPDYPANNNDYVVDLKEFWGK
jgi:hypothetical protein